MWAVVKDGKVERVLPSARSVAINGVQHSAQIFTKAWTDAERAKIGIFPAEDELGAKREFVKEDLSKPIYRIDGGRVYRSFEGKEIDVDEARERISGRIERFAERLKAKALPEELRLSAPMALIKAILEHGADMSVWPEEKIKSAKSAIEIIDYCNQVDTKKKEKIEHLASLATTIEVASYDWNDGWPL